MQVTRPATEHASMLRIAIMIQSPEGVRELWPKVLVRSSQLESNLKLRVMAPGPGANMRGSC